MTTTTPQTPHTLACDLATIFLAQHRSGGSLSANALTRRVARYLTNCAGLVRTIRLALVAQETHWPQLDPLALAYWIETNVPAFKNRLIVQDGIRATIDDVLDGTYSDEDDEEFDPELDAQERAAMVARLSESLISPLRPLPKLPATRSEFQVRMGALLPPLATHEDLLRTLEISEEELRAVVSPYGERRVPYSLEFHEKTNGTLRLIERPSAALRGLQRGLLFRVLNHVPAHPAAYGFVKGKSVADHARLHIGKAVVIRVDLKDFFPSISSAKVYSICVALGLAPAVARVFCQLTTGALSPNALRAALYAQYPGASSAVKEAFAQWQELYCVPHLPQGAPTSPALANLAAFRLDQRLDGLAKKRGLVYSRYADDLTFSGDMPVIAEQGWLTSVRDIVAQEGWVVNERKTRVMRRSGRQRVTGVVVNSFANIARRDYDLLKAQVHRYAMLPNSDPQWREQLLGRIGWLAQFHPARAAKLRNQLQLNRHA